VYESPSTAWRDAQEPSVTAGHSSAMCGRQGRTVGQPPRPTTVSLSLCHSLMCCTGTVNDPHHRPSRGSCSIPARSFRDVLPNQSSRQMPKTHHDLHLDSSHTYVHWATIATCPDRKGNKSVSKEKHCILAS